MYVITGLANNLVKKLVSFKFNIMTIPIIKGNNKRPQCGMLIAEVSVCISTAITNSNKLSRRLNELDLNWKTPLNIIIDNSEPTKIHTVFPSRFITAKAAACTIELL
jgi:hypothetical protein